MSDSDSEESFLFCLRAYDRPLLEGMVREHEFHPTRKWRFDFAWPAHRFAVEIEGITHGKGRHQQRDGFIGDAEKYEAAQLAGWTVYRVPGPWVDGSGREFRGNQVVAAAREIMVITSPRLWPKLNV